MAGETRRQRLRALLKAAGVRGVDVATLEPAFVHPSAVHEGHAPASYERLEFLGDSILGAVVARWLFKRYPDASEGELSLRKSTLCSDVALAETAERLELGALLVAGGGLDRAPHRASVLADVLEAFIGALYLQVGLAKVAAFIERKHVTEREKSIVSLDDPKTVLQEWTQRRYGRIPVYRERFEGPPHERVFHADVAIEGELVAGGSGPSKKLAQRDAAGRALDVLRERYGDLETRALSAPVPA
jgi:ribonuclease-3